MKRQYVWVLNVFTPIVFRHKKDALKRLEKIKDIFDGKIGHYTLDQCLIVEVETD